MSKPVWEETLKTGLISWLDRKTVLILERICWRNMAPEKSLGWVGDYEWDWGLHVGQKTVL